MPAAQDWPFNASCKGIFYFTYFSVVMTNLGSWNMNFCMEYIEKHQLLFNQLSNYGLDYFYADNS